MPKQTLWTAENGGYLKNGILKLEKKTTGFIQRPRRRNKNDGLFFAGINIELRGYGSLRVCVFFLRAFDSGNPFKKVINLGNTDILYI